MTSAAAVIDLYDDIAIEPSNESFVGKKPPSRKLSNAEIVPFPIGRRGNFVSNAFVDSIKYSDGQKYLRIVADRYRNRLEKIGVAPDRIRREMRDIESIFFG